MISTDDAIAQHQDEIEAPSSLLDKIGESVVGRALGQAEAATIFGEPVERGDCTVIPVGRASSRFGFGGGTGTGPTDDAKGTSVGGGGGGGGGGSLDVKPIGYIEITSSGSRFVQITDSTAIAIRAVTMGCIVADRLRHGALPSHPLVPLAGKLSSSGGLPCYDSPHDEAMSEPGSVKVAEGASKIDSPAGASCRPSSTPWWRGDTLEPVEASPDLAIEIDPALSVMSSFSDFPKAEIRRRLESGNRAVIGLVGGQLAAIGWSAAGQFEIGELGLDLQLPDGDRYLWDFVTLPEWRGQGIYPALLQSFIVQESGVQRFWVGHDLDNVASRRGILKAGFQTVGEIYASEDTGPGFVARGNAPERAGKAAELLQLPLIERG